MPYFRFAVDGTYYRRHRSLPMYLGMDESGNAMLSEPVKATITRFGYQGWWYHRPTDLYVTDDGLLLIIKNETIGFDKNGNPNEWQHCFTPAVNKRARVRYLKYTREANDIDKDSEVFTDSLGFVSKIVSNDKVIWAPETDDLDTLPKFLGTLPAKRGRKPKKMAA